MGDVQNNLPPGWESIHDDKSNNCSVCVRNTGSEDGRSRYRPGESTPTKRFIPPQHSSPELRLRNYVYPTVQASPKRAFQIPSPNSVQKDMRNVVTKLANSKIHDIDEAISKIGAMFPTVSETHIKMLMKKYHNREALVISALQVEKYPITTPGPFATPPPQRNIIVQPMGMVQDSPVTSALRGGGILRGYSSPKLLTSSPKLKLRYMKSIFPQADEMVILDILQNNDNNIQKTSDALKEMGFDKRDTVKLAQQKMEDKKIELEANKEAKVKKTIVEQLEVKHKSPEEKVLLKEKLQKVYKDVADHLIGIALESVNFDEDRASKILQIMIQEDSEAAVLSKKEEDKSSGGTELTSSKSLNVLPISQSRQSIKSLLKSDKVDKDANLFVRIIDATDAANFTSKNLSNTLGHNPTLSKGPNEKNLLEDYVKWYGPNPKLKTSRRSLAKGPNKDLLSSRSYRACGSNAALRQGPLAGLAKGSAFGKFNSTTSIVTVGHLTE